MTANQNNIPSNKILIHLSFFIHTNINTPINSSNILKPQQGKIYKYLHI